jgi:hypothetical protein
VKLVYLVGFIIKQSVTMQRGHMDVKLIFPTYIFHFLINIYTQFGHNHRPGYRQLVDFTWFYTDAIS